MKAYLITDRKSYSDSALIIFAESRGKAISLALGKDEFQYYDFAYIDLRALREPVLDKYYRGKHEMCWDDDEDRLALVKECGFTCNDDAFDPESCEICSAKAYCDRYQEYLWDE